MAIRREDTPSELVDLRIGSSWIPATPAKPGSPNQQPICTNWQENHPINLVAQANVPEPTTLTDDFLQEFDTWQAEKAANSQARMEDSCRYDKFPANDADQWTNISFGKLLALAEEKYDKAAIENALGHHNFTTMGTFGPDFRPMSFGNSSRQDFDGEFRLANFDTRGNPTPSGHYFYHNSPTSSMAYASSGKTTSFQFEPITPEKTNKSEYMQESGTRDVSKDEVPGEKEKEITEDGVVGFHMDKEKSTQLLENHKPDKESTEEANLSKTPQQKNRKKKHRPKVIIEGKKKSTPKSSAKKPSIPQDMTKAKRKYVRKKSVNNPVGGETNGSDLVNKTTNSAEIPDEKRRYRRRKIDKPEDGVHKGTNETTGVKTSRYPLRSCRRSLNFDSDGQLRDRSSSNCNRESQAEKFNTQEMEEMMKTDKLPSHEFTKSTNHVQEESLSRPKQHFQSHLASMNKDRLENSHMCVDQIVCNRGKCQIVFSDVTHDKEPYMNTNGQLTPKSPSDSICSITCLTPEKQESGLKRKCVNTTVEAEFSNRNETGAFYNSLQAYLPIFFPNADKIDSPPGLHFPPIYKKKRSEKVYSMVTSSIQIRDSTPDNHAKLERHTLQDSCTELFTSPTNLGYCGGLGHVSNMLTNNRAIYRAQNGRQVFEDLLALGPSQRSKRRRSKGLTRQRDLASLLEEVPGSRGYAATTSRSKQGIVILHEPNTCMEALVADTNSTILTKKRSKRSMVINQTVKSLYNQQTCASTSSIGQPLALTWKSMSPVDSIVEQLNQLDLNAESSQESERKCSALMAYHQYYQQQHALVPFQNFGAVVPFDSSFDQVRRRPPRPKVDLDDETTRVWKLLLEDINSVGIDGTDEEKTKWWEEERRVFRGRADSFIARMHLVQGDRRFSPWKGSVVDSVVGVFLTQNVSDHLSSSAFMSMAARYPIKSEIHQAELHEEKLCTKINEIKEPEVCLLDSDGTIGLYKEILNQKVCCENIKMLHELEDDSITEVNRAKYSGNAFDGFIPKDNLQSRSTDVSAHGPVTYSVTATKKSISFTEDERETEDSLSSQTLEISSQNSANSPIAQTTERTDSYLQITSEEPKFGLKPKRVTNSTSFVKLLQMADTVLHGAYETGREQKMYDENHHLQSESSASNLQTEDQLGNWTFPAKNIASCSQSTLCHIPNSEAQATEFDSFQGNSKTFDTSSNKECCAAEISELSSESACGTTFQKITAVSFEEVQKVCNPNAHTTNNGKIEVNKKTVGNQTSQGPAQNKMQEFSNGPTYPPNLMDAIGNTSNIDSSKKSEPKEVNSNKNDLYQQTGNMVNGPKAKGGRPRKEKENQVDWDQLRKETLLDGRERARPANNLDSVDWNAVRCEDVNNIAETIKERGMNNVLAGRIKDFLNRLVRDHGSIDLEWLRDIPPDKAKEYLLSIRGLGLKSVECVRLLTLHHLAFPVDTNVGRIAVRLGWVPLQPLPESLQLHLLELYPVLESIQQYLWPRLCKLDQKTLYELHYQMITFGKVFCTKSKPNCNACPIRGECRHFASAFASARLALPPPQEKSIVSATENRKTDQNPIRSMNTLQLPSTQANNMDPKDGASSSQPIIEEPPTPEPIIEVPATPEPDQAQVLECDIENAFDEDPDEIPTIQLNMEEFTNNLQTIMQQQNTELQEFDMSKALVALTSEAASIPVPKLKNVNRLRTEHQVYELPDSHQLLEGMDKREPDDPCPYLLAIWTPGETMNSIEPPERRCSSQELGKLCSDETCSSCNSIREANTQTVRGTLLIPCRTAMRGSFPLNGTYFQVNEVFSDHESSLCPIDVPREWLWNLPRRTVYFGTSIPTIFKGLSTEGIQYCFWRGFVCVRGFDRRTRAPRPLIARLHFPASKLAKGKGKIDENNA